LKRYFAYSLFFISLFWLIYGCTAKRNTALNRTYHSVTAKYNILFNGSESFKEGLKSYNESYKEDYSRILPVFTYGDPELSASIKPQMDRTIEKSSKVIKMHSITSKPESKKGKMTEKEKKFYSKNEYNAYVDDAYLLMGEAWFYEADYTTATQTLEYVIKQFDDEKSKYLAYNWLVRTNVEKKDFREAQLLLESISSDIKYPEKLKYQLNLTYADFFLKQQDAINAEPYIKEALEMARKKKDKLRLTYIYAQISETLNKQSIAFDLYSKVLKMNPPYEMAFNAKIKRAGLFTGGRTGNTIKNELLAMLKDDKNNDYQDQIYYALGDIEMKNKNVDKAIEYYKLSVKTSLSNTNQKGLIHIFIFHIHFNQAKYRESQAFSDSAIALLDPEFPGYAGLAKKNKYLSKLVENLKTVEFQDSVQKVAKMPEKDRLVFIQKIIDQLKIAEQEEKERAAVSNRPGDLLAGRSGIRPNTGIDESGKWYFYNPTAKSFGEPEFRRLWGTRKLEDNWRRSNKQIVGFDQVKQTELSDDILDPKKGLDNKNPEFYLVDLPLTDSALEMSHIKIQNALYNIGEIYKNDLVNIPMAVKAYKELIQRYPESDFKVASYYSLYKIYMQQNDISQADIYKNMIIRNYPESNYAKVLIDPDFFKQIEKESIEQNTYYLETFEKFKSKKYTETITRCENTINTISNKELISKYKYLKILALGQLYGTGILKTELEKFIADYPKGELNQYAGELLAYVKKNELSQVNTPPVNSPKTSEDTLLIENRNAEIQKKIEQLYSFNDKSEHYFVLIIVKKLDLNQIRFNAINFNLDYFIQKDYNTESQDFNKFFNIIVVKPFADYNEAMEYYKTIVPKIDDVVGQTEKDNFNSFVISAENFLNFNKEKAIQEYLIFFKEKYLKD